MLWCAWLLCGPARGCAQCLPDLQKILLPQNSIFHRVILAETYQYFYVVKIEQQDDDEE